MSRLSRWVDVHPWSAALILIVCITGPGYWRIEQAIDKAHDAAEAVEVETVRSTAEACNSRRDTIIVLRGLVQLRSETGGGGVDLTGVEGFADLSPDLQFYLTNLEALLNASPPPNEGFVDRALERLPVPDCT
jgi:hypothetical protein